MTPTIAPEKQQVLEGMNLILASSRDIVEKIRIISDTIKALIGVDRCTIYVHDPESKTFWSAYIDGLSYLEIPHDKGIVSQVFRTGEEVIVDNTEKEQGHFRAVDRSTGYQTRSIISVPVFGYQQRCIGVLQLINKLDGETFSREDSSILQQVSRHIASFVEYIVRKH